MATCPNLHRLEHVPVRPLLIVHLVRLSALTALLLSQTLQLVMGHAGTGNYRHAQKQQDCCQQFQHQEGPLLSTKSVAESCADEPKAQSSCMRQVGELTVHKAAPSLTVHVLLWSTPDRKRRAVAPAGWCHPCLSPCKPLPPRCLADMTIWTASSTCIDANLAATEWQYELCTYTAAVDVGMIGLLNLAYPNVCRHKFAKAKALSHEGALALVIHCSCPYAGGQYRGQYKPAPQFLQCRGCNVPAHRLQNISPAAVDHVHMHSSFLCLGLFFGKGFRVQPYTLF